MGSWMNPSPSTKAKSKPDDNDDGDNYDDHDHQEGQKDQKEDQHHSMLSRGVKRKANRDLRDEMVDDEGSSRSLRICSGFTVPLPFFSSSFFLSFFVLSFWMLKCARS